MSNALQILSIFSLMSALLCVWHSNKTLWAYPFGVFLLSGVASAWMTIESIPYIVLLAAYLFCVFGALERRSPILAVLSLIVVSIFFGAHLVPGFESIKYFDNTWLSELKNDKSIKFDADKPILGLFLLILYRNTLIKTVGECNRYISALLPIILIGTVSLYLIGIAVGTVGFDFTPTPILILWMADNLMFTVIAEEMLFRRVIQKKIADKATLRYGAQGPVIGLITTSTVFGLAHGVGGWEIALLATLAGLLYGYCYMKTERIEVAMLAHIVVNAGSVLFLYVKAT